MELEHFPTEVLSVILSGQNSSLALTLWKTGSRLLRNKLENGGVEHLNLSDRSQKISTKLPAAVSNFRLLSLVLVCPNHIEYDPNIAKEIQKSSSTLQKLKLNFSGSAEVLFAQKNDWNRIFPHMTSLSLVNPNRLVFQLEDIHLQLLPRNLTRLSLNVAANAPKSLNFKNLPPVLNSLSLSLGGLTYEHLTDIASPLLRKLKVAYLSKGDNLKLLKNCDSLFPNLESFPIMYVSSGMLFDAGIEPFIGADNVNGAGNFPKKLDKLVLTMVKSKRVEIEENAALEYFLTRGIDMLAGEDDSENEIDFEADDLEQIDDSRYEYIQRLANNIPSSVRTLSIHTEGRISLEKFSATWVSSALPSTLTCLSLTNISIEWEYLPSIAVEDCPWPPLLTELDMDYISTSYYVNLPRNLNRLIIRSPEEPIASGELDKSLAVARKKSLEILKSERSCDHQRWKSALKSHFIDTKSDKENDSTNDTQINVMSVRKNDEKFLSPQYVHAFEVDGMSYGLPLTLRTLSLDFAISIRQIPVLPHGMTNAHFLVSQFSLLQYFPLERMPPSLTRLSLSIIAQTQDVGDHLPSSEKEFADENANKRLSSAPRSPNLLQLHLRGSSNTLEDVVLLASRCTGLREFEANLRFLESSTASSRVFQKLPSRLEKLSLVSTISIANEAIGYLPKRIEALHLSGLKMPLSVVDMDNSWVKTLPATLTKLQLPMCGIEGWELQYLPRKLRFVAFGEIFHATSAHLLQLPPNLTFLEMPSFISKKWSAPRFTPVDAARRDGSAEDGSFVCDTQFAGLKDHFGTIPELLTAPLEVVESIRKTFKVFVPA